MNNSEMFEIERKREVTGNKQALVDALKENGFQSTETQHEVDTYYSRPDVDFMETVECLRIRERDGFAEMTYKPATSARTQTEDGIVMKPETNIALQSTETAIAKQLLMNIGMVRLVEVNKQRQIFKAARYDNLSVAIDGIKGAGLFVEVEVMALDKTEAQTLIGDIERLLMVENLPIVTKPYRDICMEKGL